MNWGIVIIVLIIIAIIITIAVLNWGNTVNVLASLPNYQIYYPAGQTYLGLTNAIRDPAINNAIPAYDTFYDPYVINSKIPDLGLWKIEFVTTSFSGSDQHVKLVNTIYNQLGLDNTNPTIPAEIGYVNISTNAISIPQTTNIKSRRLTPNTDSIHAYIFIYTSTGLNTFNLKSSDNDNRAVCIDSYGNPIWAIPSDTIKLAEFQLTPVNNK